ncbi:MAG: glycosyl hydrolase 53 family protein [Verrucomicrobiota bacterium]
MAARLRKTVILALTVAGLAQGGAAELITGADLSMLQYLQDHGVEYKEAGQTKDPLLIFKDHGCSCVRLRLFVAPNGNDGQVNTLSYTLRLAKRVKQAGLMFLLDLHFSDGWADPGHQAVPAEWAGLSHPQLVERVFAYTRESLAAFRREGCRPDVVEVGNEITNGLLWPDGGPLADAAKESTPASPGPPATDKWDSMADLLKAAIRGVRADDPQGPPKIMIHIDKGGNQAVCRWFFDNLQRRDVTFDVIGLSYYPFWHGTLADLKANLAALAQTYHKDIMVVETAYDTGGGDQGKLPYPITPAGQQTFLQELLRIVAATPDGRGQGVLYWAPEWIMGRQWHGPAWSGQCEARALFDSSGNMRPAVDALRP